MWVITPRGFFSVVEHRDDPERLLVRARHPEDLHSLADLIPGLEVAEDRAADYRFRAIVDRSEWTVALALMSGEIDYLNFKSAVAERQGPRRAHLYQRVWAHLRRLQTETEAGDVIPAHIEDQLAQSGRSSEPTEDR